MFLSMLRRKFSLFSSRKKLQPKNKNWDHFSKVFGKFAYKSSSSCGWASSSDGLDVDGVDF